MGSLAREHVLTNFNAAVQFSILADTIESIVPAPRLPRRAQATLRHSPKSVDRQ